MLGTFFVCCALLAHMAASDAEIRPSAADVLAQRCLFLIAALPLLVRWRSVRSYSRRRILLFLLAADALYFTYSSATSIFWAFQHGERGQIVAFILVGLTMIFILFAQFPAVLRLTNEPGTERRLGAAPASRVNGSQ